MDQATKPDTQLAHDIDRFSCLSSSTFAQLSEWTCPIRGHSASDLFVGAMEQVRKTETWYSPSKSVDLECNYLTPEEQKLCCDPLRADIGDHNESARILESEGTLTAALAAALEYIRAEDAIKAYCKNCGEHNGGNRVECD